MKQATVKKSDVKEVKVEELKADIAAKQQKQQERNEKRAAKRAAFESTVAELDRDYAEVWVSFQKFRKSFAAEIPTEKRKTYSRVFARILYGASRPGKAERLRKQLERIEAKRAQLMMELGQ